MFKTSEVVVAAVVAAVITSFLAPAYFSLPSVASLPSDDLTGPSLAFALSSQSTPRHSSAHAPHSAEIPGDREPALPPERTSTPRLRGITSQNLSAVEEHTLPTRLRPASTFAEQTLSQVSARPLHSTTEKPWATDAATHSERASDAFGLRAVLRVAADEQQNLESRVCRMDDPSSDDSFLVDWFGSFQSRMQKTVIREAELRIPQPPRLRQSETEHANPLRFGGTPRARPDRNSERNSVVVSRITSPNPVGTTSKKRPSTPTPKAIGVAFPRGRQHAVNQVTALQAGLKPDAARERQCLTEAIYFEARSEPISGQIGVAQIVMNRTRSRRYPGTICGVVYQNQHLRDRCQFSFACDGISERVSDLNAWRVASLIANQVITGRTTSKMVGPRALNYHATYVRPRWAQSMLPIGVIGRHIFYEDELTPPPRQNFLIFAKN